MKESERLSGLIKSCQKEQGLYRNRINALQNIAVTISKISDESCRDGKKKFNSCIEAVTEGTGKKDSQLVTELEKVKTELLSEGSGGPLNSCITMLKKECNRLGKLVSELSKKESELYRQREQAEAEERDKIAAAVSTAGNAAVAAILPDN